MDQKPRDGAPTPLQCFDHIIIFRSANPRSGVSNPIAWNLSGRRMGWLESDSGAELRLAVRRGNLNDRGGLDLDEKRRISERGDAEKRQGRQTAGCEPRRQGPANRSSVSGSIVDDVHRELDDIRPGGAARLKGDPEVGKGAVELSLEAAVARGRLEVVDADLAGDVEVTQAFVLDHDDLAKGG